MTAEVRAEYWSIPKYLRSQPGAAKDQSKIALQKRISRVHEEYKKQRPRSKPFKVGGCDDEVIVIEAMRLCFQVTRRPGRGNQVIMHNVLHFIFTIEGEPWGYDADDDPSDACHNIVFKFRPATFDFCQENGVCDEVAFVQGADEEIKIGKPPHSTYKGAQFQFIQQDKRGQYDQDKDQKDPVPTMIVAIRSLLGDKSFVAYDKGKRKFLVEHLDQEDLDGNCYPSLQDKYLFVLTSGDSGNFTLKPLGYKDVFISYDHHSGAMQGTDRQAEDDDKSIWLQLLPVK